MTRKETRH